MVDLGKSDYSNHNRICQPLWKNVVKNVLQKKKWKYKKSLNKLKTKITKQRRSWARSETSVCPSSLGDPIFKAEKEI
jgi:hypothetical protein